MNGHVPPSTTHRRFGAAVAVGAAIWVACAAGCTRDRMLARIDTQVDTLIREEQRQALGAHAQTDSAAVPDTTQQVNGYTDATVRTELPTPNPSASKLPIERRESAPVDENQPPRMLDHDAPNALALNLQGVLAFAIEHSREYRNEKEGLFLAAIGVLVERHMYSPRFFNTTTVEFSGTPADDALLNNGSRGHGLYGPPSISSERMLEWIAEWVGKGGALLGKPTHFESRDGKF